MILKILGIEVLFNYMCQITNTYAIGSLVIDEIQHLSVKNSGGAEKILNLFVTLINVIGLPVVMVGTPKAKFIFEGDLSSTRRGAGFGAHIKPATTIRKTLNQNEWIGLSSDNLRFKFS
ncbi:TPA: AAA family ATPase [Acinetobacter baumannii]|nr:ATP-binding protein [Acinetobacter baumannii]EKV4525492.1 AAA family ATPase [Acinetobacter baumannii]MCT9416167.1 ATP-binding protein [Acinetobacter baumannii]MDC5063590.1 ATP-binding protein [Acinetobacter baumannii]HCH8075499.1 AAA family ATPase [Acinetobacter baumannii]HDF7034783.1 AAA family ATPase [Acinetobacter baumannii]